MSAAAAAFPGIDRDLAVTGALLHDIGKTQAYNSDPLAIDLTDAGRLLGEIPIGYYLVRREIESIEGFDPELGQAVLHIILSHHGTHEMGSPVVPATREATLVHMMDNLGGRLGSFDRIERELADGQSWSKFDRGLDSAAYFPVAPRGLAGYGANFSAQRWSFVDVLIRRLDAVEKLVGVLLALRLVDRHARVLSLVEGVVERVEAPRDRLVDAVRDVLGRVERGLDEEEVDGPEDDRPW